MRRLFCGFLLSFGIFAATALADITPIGDTIPSQSWGQMFQWSSSSGSFDQFQFHMQTPAATFEAPSIRNFNVTNWSDADLSDAFALAIGAATNQLKIQVTFNGTANQSLAFDFVGFKVGENTVGDGAHLSWNGSQWTITAIVNNGDYNRVSMAEPSAMILIPLESLLAVGVGLIFLKRSPANS